MPPGLLHLLPVTDRLRPSPVAGLRSNGRPTLLPGEVLRSANTLQKVTSTRKSAALASLGVLLAVLLMGCGGDSPAPEKVSDPVTTDADTPADHTDASLEDVDAELECTLPGSLLADLTIQRQLVLNVAVAGGANLNSVQATSPLEPDVFRSTADVLDGLDLSGLQSVPQFDAPEDVVAD